jgi:hypothetical protein
MMDQFAQDENFELGRVKVSISIDETGAENIACAIQQFGLLRRLLDGMASKEDAEMFARLINGPTVDKALNRSAAEARPCGCKGKDVLEKP